ncbi:MAG: ABC transporter ATP-binding protein [Blautia sp.]
MSKEKETGKEKGRIRQLARYYIPYKGLFFTDMFFAMLGAAITLVIPLIVRYITSTVVEKPLEQATGEIICLGILMIAMVLVEMYCNFYIAYYGHVMGARIEHDMRNEIFGHYQKLSFAFFDNQKVGHLLSRITSDLFDISELLHHGPENIVISFIKLIGAMIILFVVNPMLACVPLVVIVVMLLFALVMNSRMKSAFKENRRRIADINSQIEDSLSGIRVVKSFGNETEEMRKFNAGNDRFVDSKKVSYRYMGIYNSGMGAFSTLITVISLIVGALLMTGGKLGAADLVTFLLYINNCTDPVKKLVNFTEQFQNGYSGYERFLEIMSIAPDIQDKPDALPLKNVQGEVTFENVSFHYEESKENVLSNVNLHVPAGDYVALVGSSGAGKTTLCSLIPRFYDVTEGRILLDGKDIRDVKLKDLRDEIGIVQQDVYLFAGTIIDNIRYGRPDATDEEVIRAAKAANAHEFIMELADGYDTDIGQRGVKLSGGQKQRLSIARVFLKNPPILIFDEATSALDNESEKVVQKSLELLAKDRTTFVIAHRLSTIRNAKRILVLTENGIAEEGTHKELLAKGGIYAHLYEMQF